jgi:hypothetical protein
MRFGTWEMPGTYCIRFRIVVPLDCPRTSEEEATTTGVRLEAERTTSVAGLVVAWLFCDLPTSGFHKKMWGSTFSDLAKKAQELQEQAQEAAKEAASTFSVR